VNEAHDRATEVLTRHRGLLDQLSKILIVDEVIDGPNLQAYLDGSKPIPTPEELEAHARHRDDESPSGATGPDIVLQPGPS
jgi:hypothetical protein